MAICAPSPAICRIKTPGSVGLMAFTLRGWLNPDIALYFRFTALIRTLSRWCFGRVSGLKGSQKILSILPIKARRVGRSTQTHLDADHGPLRAEHNGTRKWRLGGAVAIVARPH